MCVLQKDTLCCLLNKVYACETKIMCVVNYLVWNKSMYVQYTVSGKWYEINPKKKWAQKTTERWVEVETPDNYDVQWVQSYDPGGIYPYRCCTNRVFITD